VGDPNPNRRPKQAKAPLSAVSVPAQWPLHPPDSSSLAFTITSRECGVRHESVFLGEDD